MILTGGNADASGRTEAAVMREILAERGVADVRMILEDQAKSTKDNFKNTAQIIDPGKPVVLISSDYHMDRAVQTAKAAGFTNGILNASSGIGGSLLSPLMQALQASLGIGKLLVILSVPVLVLLPICLWVTRVSAAPVMGKREQIDVLGRLKQALADPDYRRLMIGFGTCGFHMCIIQTHIFSQIVSYGIAERTASLAYTVFGLTTMAGSVLCGFLFGITFGGHQIGGFISSWLGGVFIAQSGNYQAIWMFDIALCAIASAASYGIHRDVKRLSRAPER